MKEKRVKIEVSGSDTNNAVFNTFKVDNTVNAVDGNSSNGDGSKKKKSNNNKDNTKVKVDETFNGSNGAATVTTNSNSSNTNINKNNVSSYGSTGMKKTAWRKI